MLWLQPGPAQHHSSSWRPSLLGKGPRLVAAWLTPDATGTWVLPPSVPCIPTTRASKQTKHPATTTASNNGQSQPADRVAASAKWVLTLNAAAAHPQTADIGLRGRLAPKLVTREVPGREEVGGCVGAGLQLRASPGNFSARAPKGPSSPCPQRPPFRIRARHRQSCGRASHETQAVIVGYEG